MKTFEWMGALADASLQYRELRPDEEIIDRMEFGEAEYAQEVTKYVKSRAWFRKKKSNPPTLILGRDTDPAVGFIKMAFKSYPNSNAHDPNRPCSLLIFVLGVTTPYQGQKNPYNQRDENWSDSIMRLIEEVFCRSRKSCREMRLRVKAENLRGIAFYQRVGFDIDEVASAELAKQGQSVLSMYKSLGTNCP